MRIKHLFTDIKTTPISGGKYPADTVNKFNIGYRRSLSVEAALAFHPDLIIASGDIGPPEMMDDHSLY